MIAVDTNILIYAHRQDTPFHAAAARAMRGLAEGSAPWCIPWPAVFEFWNIATHPRIFKPPSTPAQARDQLRAWAASPTCRLIGDAALRIDDLDALVAQDIRDGQAHDARIALVCATHQISELWTLDRDFSRMPWLRTRNPLAAG